MLLSLDGTHILNGNSLKFKFGSKIKTGQIIAMNRLASLLNSENITPQLISDLHQNKNTTPNKEERVRKINATILDAIKAYTPMGWAWSDVQVLQRQQIQTPARQTVSTRRTRHTLQRQTESMDIDPGCSNTQPNNCSRQTQTNNNPTSQPNKRQKRNPIHFLELTENPIASLPNSSEPLQPGETAATKICIINITMQLFGNVKACNTILKYDYQIQEVLDWQRISKPKRNTNATSQAQYKILENGRYPCSKARG